MLEKDEIVTSVIALAELSDKYARENREFEPFLEFIQGKAKIIPLHQSIAVEAGKLKKELREIEKNVSLADAIHFQTAKSVGAVFVTGDPDFKLVDGILFLG